MGVVICVPAVIIKDQISESRIHQAATEVETQSVRLASNPNSPILLGVESRAPASAEPNLGNDPWGHPYRYQFLRDPHGQITDVAVWSAGPNGEFETFTPRRSAGQNAGFAGDDIGLIQPLKQAH